MHTDLNAASELYLGRDRQTALSLGPKHFRTAENAIRFAMEQAAPVSRHGALLKVSGRQLGPAQIASLHRRLGQPKRRPNLALLQSSDNDSP